jgi:hypothetical protein
MRRRKIEQRALPRQHPRWTQPGRPEIMARRALCPEGKAAMDPRLTVSSVEDAHDGSLRINGKYLIERSNYDAVVGASLSEDVQIIAFHEEHYRKLILAESNARKRSSLYERAYSELSVLSNLRNQTEHGISERIVELIRPWLRGSRRRSAAPSCGSSIAGAGRPLFPGGPQPAVRPVRRQPAISGERVSGERPAPQRDDLR